VVEDTLILSAVEM